MIAPIDIINFFKSKTVKLVLFFVCLFFAIVFLLPIACRMIFTQQNTKAQIQVKESEYNSKTGVKKWNPLKVLIDGSDNEEGYSENNILDDYNKGTAASGYSNSSTGRNYAGGENKQGGFINNSVQQNGTQNIQPVNSGIEVSHLSIYNAEADNMRGELKEYIPYGTLVKCQLVTTVQTGGGKAPIIGMVTEDVMNAGKVIIPAGTYLHGFSDGMPIRDAVLTDDQWVFVWRTADRDNGKELKVRAIALQNGSHWDGKHWDQLDGAVGIHGYTVDNRNLSDLKNIVVATASGIGNGLANAGSAAGVLPGVGEGSEVISAATESVGNALASGAGSTAEVMAKASLQNMLESEYYVTSPGGTQFYLIVLETVDKNNAKRGRMLG